MKATFTLKNTIILVTFLGAFTLNAQTYVDNNVGANANFSSLQDAIDAASPNDVIYVQPSPNSYGDIIINKPLTIVGRSHSDPSKRSFLDGLTINENGSGSSLKGLSGSIRLTGKDGTYSSTTGNTTAPVLVENISVINCLGSVIAGGLKYFNNSSSSTPVSGATNVIVQGSIISASGEYINNLVVSNSIVTQRIATYVPSTTIIKNCIFLSNSSNYNPVHNYYPTVGILKVQDCIFLSNSGDDYTFSVAGINLINSLTYNFGAGNYNIGAAQNMTVTDALPNINPLFTKITIPTSGSQGFLPLNIEDNFMLQTGSPAIGAGINGEDLGVFAGYNFNNLGIPAGYPTVNIISSTASIPENGTLRVTLTAKAQ